MNEIAAIAIFVKKIDQGSFANKTCESVFQLPWAISNKHTKNALYHHF